MSEVNPFCSTASIKPVCRVVSVTSIRPLCKIAVVHAIDSGFRNVKITAGSLKRKAEEQERPPKRRKSIFVMIIFKTGVNVLTKCNVGK